MIHIKQSKLFPCYSIPMRDFFTSKGIKYELVGLHPKTHDMFWIYIKTNEDILAKVNHKLIRPNRKRVICLNTQKIYESIHIASKDSNVNKKSISACCNHRQCNTYSKDGEQFQWMFLDEYLQQAS